MSIGYRARPLPGLDGDSFDYRKGVVNNVHGKILGSNVPEHGLYSSGWLKRGPSGIIGTNIADARDTVASLMFDLEHGRIGNHEVESQKKGRRGLLSMLDERNVTVIDWTAYQRIDAAEKSRKRNEGQPREKIVSVKEMILVATKNGNNKGRA